VTPKTFMLLAGEASGDTLAAALVFVGDDVRSL
jgi:lipid A disaccharide synthetase